MTCIKELMIDHDLTYDEAKDYMEQIADAEKDLNKCDQYYKQYEDDKE